MVITKVCPDCGDKWATVEGHHRNNLGRSELEIACPGCHAKRREKLRQLEAMYPSAEQLGLLGSMTPSPVERLRRPHSSGRRIIRKSEHMAG